MRRVLRIIAAILVVGAIVFWAATGANRGLTETQVQLKTIDEVTGLNDNKWKDTFVPGIDFLGAALLGAGILAGISFLFRPKSNPSANQN